MIYEAEYEIFNTISGFRDIVGVHWANGILGENLLIAIYISDRYRSYCNLVVSTLKNQHSFLCCSYTFKYFLFFYQSSITINCDQQSMLFINLGKVKYLISL